MKKIAIILVLILVLSTMFISCVDNGKKPKAISYEEIYMNKLEKTQTITGCSVYKASYGYTLSEEQGYNGFYYVCLKNGAYSSMNFQGGKWQSGKASLKEGVMTSASEEIAVRKFVAPISGQAKVYGNPYLVSEGSITAVIRLNGSDIYSADIETSLGVYHSQIVELTAGDEIYFEARGSGSIYWNPTVDYAMQDESLLHGGVDGYYGDVHPYYDLQSKTMYMYYLSTGRQQQVKTEIYSSMLTVSTDMINYAPLSLRMDENNPPEQELYYALGIYKDKDGNYRSSYGKGNYAGGSVSADLLTWSNGAKPYIDEKDGLLKYTFRAYFDKDVYSGRDPDIFYDEASQTYYMVVMNYYSNKEHAGSKGLALYKAGIDGKFSTNAVKLLDCTGRGDPECPQLKKIGDRWYLFYSIYGTGTGGGVGNLRYRIGDVNTSPDKVDWNSKSEHCLDGGDLHAAQLVAVGDRFYMYGWIGYYAHANVWGGYLNIAREVFQKEDGTLGSRCDSYLTRLLNKGLVADFVQENVSLNNMAVLEDGFVSSGNSASATLNKTVDRSLIYATVILPQNASYAGYCLQQGGTKYYVALFRSGGKLYLAVTKDISNPLSGVSIEIDDKNAAQYDLKIIAESNFIEVFVNDEYSLTANTLLTSAPYNLSLVCGGSGVKLTEAKVYKLADSKNIFD